MDDQFKYIPDYVFCKRIEDMKGQSIMKSDIEKCPICREKIFFDDKKRNAIKINKLAKVWCDVCIKADMDYRNITIEEVINRGYKNA